MTTDERHDLRKWMEERFDRLDEKVERKGKDLFDEIVDTRHGLKETIVGLTMQIVENTVETRVNTSKIREINAWRADGGPLDERLHRHSQRDDSSDAWRNRMVGGIAVIVILFPATVAVIVATLR